MTFLSVPFFFFHKFLEKLGEKLHKIHKCQWWLHNYVVRVYYLGSIVNFLMNFYKLHSLHFRMVTHKKLYLAMMSKLRVQESQNLQKSKSF